MKHIVESALVRGGVARLARGQRAGDVLVLAYHDIVPHGQPRSGDGALHMAQESFAAQLDSLRRTHEVIGLEAALAATGPAAGSRPRAVITFDDAYRGALTAGIEELERRALPATIFVAPSFVGGRSFWWDEAAAGFGGVLPLELREKLLHDLRGEHGRIVEWLDAQGRRGSPLPAYARCASEEELDAASRLPGMTVGSHSWSHPNLARLDGDELMEELTRPLRWIRERFGAAIPVLSYPYGATAFHVQRAVRDAGYEAAMLIAGGWLINGGGSDRYSMPRLDVPSGLSLNGFRLRASGVLGQ